MDIVSVLIATALVAILGLIVGLLLGVASVIFKVDVNEQEAKVREMLPGNNCGGCGYAGCDALAKAIAEGIAPVNACPVGGAVVAQKIAKVMGVDVGDLEKKQAFVHCSGSCSKTQRAYIFTGLQECTSTSILPNHGEKKCNFACIGFGSCVKNCLFHAISIVDGVAVVNTSKCTGCGACVKTCPMHLIDLVPESKTHLIGCSSHFKGPEVMKACEAGCIGCGLCAKSCPNEAITMVDNLPVIDYTKCNSCGTCASKCPRKTITIKR